MGTHRPRQHPTNRQNSNRPARSERSVRGSAGARLRTESRSWCLQVARRRPDVAKGAVQEQRHRRNRSGVRPDGLANGLRVALEYQASALDRLSTVLRAGQRPLQIDRRRDELAANYCRFANRRPRPHRHRGSAVESESSVRNRRRQRGWTLPLGRRRCVLHQGLERRSDLGPRLVFRQGCGGSQKR